MDFLLKIDAHSTVAANNLIGANAGIRRNVPTGIRNSNVGRNITDRMMSALDGGDNEASGKFLTRNKGYGLRWPKTPQSTCGEPEQS
jgi:hypothetical protein